MKLNLETITQILNRMGVDARDPIDTINLTSIADAEDIAAEKLNGKWVIYNKRLVERRIKKKKLRHRGTHAPGTDQRNRAC